MKTMQKMVGKRSLRAAAAFVTSLTAVLVAASCGGTSSNSGTDSNTHWLDQCSKDADCGSLSCRCGVCTRACTTGSECTDLAASATCSALPGCPTTGTSCVRSPARDAGPAECPSPAITPGTACEPVDHPCWSTCTQGYREELTCTGGKWTPGHGLFPCADGGIVGAGGGTSGGGGASGTGGATSAGGSGNHIPFDSGTGEASCRTDSDCVAADRTCCGACGQPSAADKVALNTAAAARQHALLCSTPVACDPCTREPGTITALCESGTCQLTQITQMAECLQTSDCTLLAKDCCDCADNRDNPNAFVAVNKSSSYPATYCKTGSCFCPPPPDAAADTMLNAACLPFGYCAVLTGAPPP